MRLSIDELPDWTVEIDEISVGIYRVLATHRLGPTIELMGTDDGELVARIKASALAMQTEIAKKTGRS